MPKLYSSKEILRVLERKGFVFVSQRGSHIKLRKIESCILTVIVPCNKKSIPMGTFKSILRQANINFENFKNLL